MGAPEGVVIRRFRRTDMAALLRVEEECFPPGRRYSELTFRYLMSLPGSVTLVAEVGGEVAGYALGYLEPGGVGHVASLAVRPAYRRRGVGTALLRALEGELAREGARAFRLEVAASNREARRLYEREGYEVVGVLPGYYGGEDGLLMEKRPGRGRARP
mgnify:FL=1